MLKNIENNAVIVGCGGFGREMYEMISRDYNVIGFVDDFQKDYIKDIPILGNCEYLLTYKESISVFICIANTVVREKIYKKLSQNKLLMFPSIISNFARVSKTLTMGIGNIICDNVVVTVDSKLGNFAIIDNTCLIGHDVRVDDFVTLYPGAIVAGNVHIGNNCELGTGCNIIQGLDIGKRTIIGAGAVVVRNIPENCTAVGVPAKPIKFREEN